MKLTRVCVSRSTADAVGHEHFELKQPRILQVLPPSGGFPSCGNMPPKAKAKAKLAKDMEKAPEELAKEKEVVRGVFVLF